MVPGLGKSRVKKGKDEREKEREQEGAGCPPVSGNAITWFSAS